MSWAVGDIDGRDVGYGVPAECDHPECKAKIDRGLAYQCEGCKLFFCGGHGGGWKCERCDEGKEPFEPKPDLPEWLEHKETDPSWAAWRAERDARKEQGSG